MVPTGFLLTWQRVQVEGKGKVQKQVGFPKVVIQEFVVHSFFGRYGFAPFSEHLPPAPKIFDITYLLF